MPSSMFGRSTGEADVLAGADRPRAEPRARPVRHALVERRADDRDVGAGQPRGLEHERHAAERQADAGVAVLVGAVGLEATLGHEVAII